MHLLPDILTHTSFFVFVNIFNKLCNNTRIINFGSNSLLKSHHELYILHYYTSCRKKRKKIQKSKLEILREFHLGSPFSPMFLTFFCAILYLLCCIIFIAISL